MIRYETDDNNNRVGYQCRCGADDFSHELWGHSWLINHQAEEIEKVLNG